MHSPIFLSERLYFRVTPKTVLGSFQASVIDSTVPCRITWPIMHISVGYGHSCNVQDTAPQDSWLMIGSPARKRFLCHLGLLHTVPHDKVVSVCTVPCCSVSAVHQTFQPLLKERKAVASLLLSSSNFQKQHRKLFFFHANFLSSGNQLPRRIIKKAHSGVRKLLLGLQAGAVRGAYQMLCRHSNRTQENCNYQMNSKRCRSVYLKMYLVALK